MSDIVSITPAKGEVQAAPTNDRAIGLQKRSAEAAGATCAKQSAIADRLASVPNAAAHMPVATETALPEEEPDGLPLGY